LTGTWTLQPPSLIGTDTPSAITNVAELSESAPATNNVRLSGALSFGPGWGERYRPSVMASVDPGGGLVTDKGEEGIEHFGTVVVVVVGPVVVVVPAVVVVVPEVVVVVPVVVVPVVVVPVAVVVVVPEVVVVVPVVVVPVVVVVVPAAVAIVAAAVAIVAAAVVEAGAQTAP
jgi:hypothetical protein